MDGHCNFAPLRFQSDRRRDYVGNEINSPSVSHAVDSRIGGKCAAEDTEKTEGRQKALLTLFEEVRRKISLPAATSEVIIHQKKKQTDPI